MKKKILLYKAIPEQEYARLAEHFELIYIDKLHNMADMHYSYELKRIEGLIGASVPIDTTILDMLPNLKAISTISVGYDNFDVNELTRRGIRLMHTPDVLTDTTADTIFMLMLCTARRAMELSQLIYNRQWLGSIGEHYYGVDVHHKTVGIIGMGRIGRAVAKRAYAGFDMKILYTSSQRKSEVEQQYQAQYCELDHLLMHADFVCITLPLSPSTERLLSREKLALMKPSAILINGARGKIVEQQALITALKERKIMAAGLDVFEQEPLPFDSELLSLPNVVLLPHIGSATKETRQAMARCAVDNLIMALQQATPQGNWVNPEVG